MKYELIDNIVPVSVNNMKDIWYIDVSNLSLSPYTIYISPPTK